MLSPGTRLATYEVRERLAVGGMGEVYLCRHRLLDRVDAVKVLRPHLVADQAFRRRFLREALSAARLRHPHIVTVYTADEVDGQLFLAMEYIPGLDLAAILDQELVLAPERALPILAQIADALDAAHRLAMTHRDVKPSNVLVDRAGDADEHAYLVDFGLSKSAAAVDQDITVTGQVMGTVAYIAPEQLHNQPVDGRGDQYSLACMTFECLTGRLPFPRDNQVAVITAHLTAEPPSLTELRPGLPPALDAVVARGMAKTPEERYATCSEFVAALRAATTPVPVTPVPASPGPEGTVLLNPDALGPGAAPPGYTLPMAVPTALGPPPVAIPGVPAGPTFGLAPDRETPPTRAPDPGEPDGAGVGPDQGGALTTRLYAAVVGGPEAGTVLPLKEGDRALALGESRMVFHVDGWAVRMAGDASVTVNGQVLAGGARPLTPGDLVTAGPALLEVRAAAKLARLDPGWPPDAVTVERVVADKVRGVVRGPLHADTLVARIGWSPGRPPRPVTVRLGDPGGVAVRGPGEATVPFVRWLIAQLAALHDPRDLCLAAAVAPAGGERWTWLSSVPHARPRTPPLSGTHLATTEEGARDLGIRLLDLVEIRRAAVADTPAQHALIRMPRVVAVLDEKLLGAEADAIAAAGDPLGVHVVRLLGPAGRPAPHCRRCVDLDPSGTGMTVHTAGRKGAQLGAPDGVSAAYARQVTELLDEA